jgi:hypothetical protein
VLGRAENTQNNAHHAFTRTQYPTLQVNSEQNNPNNIGAGEHQQNRQTNQQKRKEMFHVLNQKVRIELAKKKQKKQRSGTKHCDYFFGGGVEG